MKYHAPFNSTDPTASWVDGNPSAGIQGSIPSAASIESVNREIVAVIAAAGIIPSDADYTQLLQAIEALGASSTSLVHWGLDSGAANAMICTVSPVIHSYAAGTVLVTIPAADNTGATTCNASNLGTQPVVRPDNTSLQPKDVRGGFLTFFVHDGTSFRLAFTFASATSIIYDGTDTGTANALAVGTVTPALSAPSAGELFLIKKSASGITSTSTLDLLGTTAPLLWADGSVTALGDWPANCPALLEYDGTDYNLLSVMGPSVFARASSVMPILLGATDYYVATTGSDSNPGTSGSPFLTLPKALATVAKFNLNGFNVIIHVADGTYTSSTPIAFPPVNGSGTVSVTGNVSTPANCSFVCTQGSTFTFGAGVTGYIINGFKLSVTGGRSNDPSSCVWCGTNGSVTLHDITFGTAYTAWITANPSYTIIIYGNITFAGVVTVGTVVGGPFGIFLSSFSLLTNPGGQNLAISIPNAVTLVSFFDILNQSSVSVTYNSLTGGGNVTGSKYNIVGNSTIFTPGSGAAYWPVGSTSGTTSYGGQII